MFTPNGAQRKRTPIVRLVLNYFVLPVFLLFTLALSWLRWDAGLPRDEWLVERHGHLDSAVTEGPVVAAGHLSESVRVISDTGLQVSFRVIRKEKTGARVIVGVDYPYDGPDKAQGIASTAKTILLARQAILDTVPAVSLILDWLTEQAWVDTQQIIIVGASLGVPFATAAAARDKRISGLMLIHGAADTRL